MPTTLTSDWLPRVGGHPATPGDVYDGSRPIHAAIDEVAAAARDGGFRLVAGLGSPRWSVWGGVNPVGLDPQLALMPGGRLVVTAVGQRLQVTDAATGEGLRMRVLDDPQSDRAFEMSVVSMALEPGGAAVIFGSFGSRVFRWDPARDEVRELFRAGPDDGGAGGIYDLAVDANGTVVVGGDYGVYRYDLASGALRSVHAGPASCVATSDGAILWAGHSGAPVWMLEDGEPRQIGEEGHRLLSLDMLDDGVLIEHRLRQSPGARIAYIKDPRNGATLRRYEGVLAARPAGEGVLLVYDREVHHYRHWEDEAPEVFRCSWRMADVAWHPDAVQPMLVGFTWGTGRLAVWPYDDRYPHTVGSGNGGPIVSLALSPDGERCATVAIDGTIRVFEIATRRMLLGFEFPLEWLVFYDWAIGFSPSGTELIVSARHQQWLRVDLETEQTGWLPSCPDDVPVVVRSADSASLAIARRGTRVAVVPPGGVMVLVYDGPDADTPFPMPG